MDLDDEDVRALLEEIAGIHHQIKRVADALHNLVDAVRDRT